MNNLIKQLNRAGKVLAQAVEVAHSKAEEEVLRLLGEAVDEKGIDDNEIDKRLDFSLQTLQTDPENGVLINEVYIVGEKASKTVIAAYRIEISYRPEGFKDKALAMKVRGRVENVTGSFFYPEDDESIFH